MRPLNSKRVRIGHKTFIRSYKCISPFESGKQEGVVFEVVEPQYKQHPQRKYSFRSALISIGFFLFGLTLGFVFAVT